MAVKCMVQGRVDRRRSEIVKINNNFFFFLFFEFLSYDGKAEEIEKKRRRMR